MWHNGMGMGFDPGFFFIVGFFKVLGWVLFLGLIFGALRFFRRGGRFAGHGWGGGRGGWNPRGMMGGGNWGGRDEALETARERLAKSELTPEQFEELVMEERVEGALRDPEVVERLDGDVPEARPPETLVQGDLRQGARQAAGPRRGVSLDLGRQIVVEDEVNDRQAAPGSKDAERLGEDAHLARRQIDHAIADHDIDRGVGQREGLDLALDEADVEQSRFGR